MRLVKLISSLCLCLAQIAQTGHEYCASLPDTDCPLNDTEYLTCSTSSGPTMTDCRAPTLISDEPRYITSHNPWRRTLFVGKLSCPSVSTTLAMHYLTNYLTYPSKEQPGAVYVPRVRIETCHAGRRLVSALWQIDSMLVTRSSLKPSRGIVVNDVDLACLDVLVESDILLGGDENLTVIHVLTPHRLDILRYLALVSIHHMSDVQSVQKFDSLSACPERPLVC